VLRSKKFTLQLPAAESLIIAYTGSSDPSRAVKLLKEFAADGPKPLDTTYNAVINALSSHGHSALAADVFKVLFLL